MKLVDTLAEQDLLESIVERTKPLVPPGCAHLHYLLATPFRYGAAYPRGSRFRRPGHTPGVFYASRAPATAVAEMAFHRLLFFAESPGTPWPVNAAEYTAFASEIRTRAALDLTKPPLVRQRAQWMHCTDYEACQHLAEQARTAAIDAIVYSSVRDPAGGSNVAILTCQPFVEAKPVNHQMWRIQLGATGVRAVCSFPDTRLEFDRPAFAADPRIAALRWDRSET
jgi:hypothetical protein